MSKSLYSYMYMIYTMVDKIASVKYTQLPESDNPIISIKLKEQWTSCLIDVEYADRVTILWDYDRTDTEPLVQIFAIKEIDGARDIISTVEEYYEPKLKEAIEYVSEELQ